MTIEKICPIKSIGKTPAARCISTACAWWDEDNERCSLCSLGPVAAHLKSIDENGLNVYPDN